MALKEINSASVPKHHSPNADRAAFAPYNFVPLPDVVIKAVESAEELPDHDRFIEGRYTGHFEVTLTTKTPLYIRGGLSTNRPDEMKPSEYEQAEAEKAGNAPQDFRQAMKNKAQFFTTHDPEQPVIPGSSLRGMLHSLVEIITYSKMKWVTDKPIIYRAVGDPTAVGNSYREKVLGKNKTAEPDMHFDYPISQLKGGYLRKTNAGWAIQPAQQFLGESFVRVEYADAEPLIGGRNRHLFHDVHVRPVARTPSPRGRRGPGNLTLDVAVTKNVSLTPIASLKPAKLVESGHMGGDHAKHWHCAIYEPNTTAKLIDISVELWQIYQEDRDMTRGFKTRKLTRDGDPLFYLLNAKNELVFFGPTVMFRLPYYQQARDLVKEWDNPNDIDLTEAMFGFVRTQKELDEMATTPKQGSKGRGYAGRVFVGDGRYEPDQGSPWMADASDGIIEPHILASPKPTSFQHYLTQETPNDRKKLYHYDSNQVAGKQVTTLRGFKLYWAQGQKTARDLQARPKDNQDEQRTFEWGPDGKLRPKSNSTQHTRMKPVASGKKFMFHVYFENLSDIELGALQWVLTVPNCHRLGMGKPLGMGVIQLEKPVLRLNSRSDRYKTLLDNNTWNAGAPEQKQDFITDFETAMVTKLRERQVAVPGTFRQVERIKMLLTMLDWNEGTPDWLDKTRYMEIDRPTGHLRRDGRPETFNEYKERPVLPDPLYISGVPRTTPRSSGGPGFNRPFEPRHDQPRPAPQPGKSKSARPPQQPPDDKLPEATEDTSDFARRFIQQMQEKGEQDLDKKRANRKKKRR